MQIFAVLCLAAVALARPQDYNSKDAVTTVTERTFTIRGNADKYYGASGSGSSSFSAGSGFAGGVSSYSAAQPSYSFKTVASAVPVAQQSYQQSYQTYQQAAPAVNYQASYQAAAAPAVNYQATYQAAPVSYQASYAAPAFNAAPALSYAAAPALSYAAAPAVGFAAAPAINYAAAAPAVFQQAQSVGIRAESNFGGNFEQNNYDTSFQNSQVSGADTKVFKHVYAFAAPEEPATRATVRVQAPISKRKHYKLVFIKAPSQQTIVDSDITLPAQEEEKTLIYVLSKNQKQQQPEIRIKQAAASKHAKPEVFFLKYKNEAEAQAIASGAISGQSADIPAQGEIISDGSVSILGQNSGSSFGSSGFGSDSASFSSDSASFGSSFGSSGAQQVAAVAAPIEYRSSGVSAVSSGSLGLANPAVSAVGDSAASSGFSYNSGSSYNGASGAGLSGGFSAYKSGSSSFSQEPASVAISVTSEPSLSLEGSTASSLSL